MPVFILNNAIRDCKKKKKIKKILKENKYELITYFAMVVGFIIRLINLEKMPNGLIPDEASAGYEAFSILNYGTDRLGKLPCVFNFMGKWAKCFIYILVDTIYKNIRTYKICGETSDGYSIMHFNYCNVLLIKKYF